jgi:uncharacterized protein (DUF2384 family)
MAKRYSEIECPWAQVIAQAVKLSEGDRKMAENWPSKPPRTIDHDIPIDYIDSPERAQQPLDIKGRLEHGTLN